MFFFSENKVIISEQINQSHKDINLAEIKYFFPKHSMARF